MPPIPHRYTGGCHCGTIRFTAEFAAALQGKAPRACDCDYCSRHGAAYLSDPRGRLRITIADLALVNRYHQGSGIADFWVCRRCGVLVAVSHEANEHLYATINARALDEADTLVTAQPVSPQRLDEPERIARWKSLWFNDVEVIGA